MSVIVLLGLVFGTLTALAQTGTLDDDLDAAYALMRAGQFEAALAASTDVARRAEAAGDQPALAKALLRQSDAYYYLGNHEATLPPLERALPIYESIGDLSGVGRVLYSIAYYYERVEPQTMISYLEQASSYAEWAADHTLRMNIANATGSAHWNMGAYRKAIAAYETSADLAFAASDTASRATSLQNIGMVHVHLGENRQALEYLNLALADLTAAGRPQSVAVVLGNAGNAYVGLRDFEAALDCYERSLALHRDTGYRRGQGVQLMNISAMHQRMNEPQKALPLVLESLAISRDVGDDRGAIGALSSYGYLQMTLGDEADADASWRQAIAQAEAFGDPYLLMEPEKGLARLAADRGDTTEAFYWADRAEKHALELNDTYSLAVIKAVRARLLAEVGRLPAAIAETQKAIDLHTQTHCRTYRHQWHADLAVLYLQTGQPDAARAQFDLGLDCIADLDAVIAMDRFRVHLFQEVADIINTYAAWLGETGLTKKGLEILDWGRARELTMRVLQEKTIADFSEEELAALDKISAFQQKIRQEALTDDQRQDILASLEQAEAQYDRARQAGVVVSDVRSRPHLALPVGDVMTIEYAVHADTLLVFSTYDNRVSFRKLPGVVDLMERVTAFRSLVSNPNSGRSTDLAGAYLFEVLMGPEFLNGSPEELILIPCGSLWALPFAALKTDQNTCLGEQTVLSFTPSLHSLPGFQSDAAKARRGLLALANTEFSETQNSDIPLSHLNAVIEEAQNIGRLSDDATVLLEADEALVKSLPLDQYQLIHWASHTLMDETNPERSSIVVGPTEHEDGYLQVREIYRLNLDARLVVVSGCSSGGGCVVPGEGLLGLSHALLSAGANATVLSRWDISDAGAAVFMDAFYKAAQTQTVAESVRYAQQVLRGSELWNHPSVWAAFFVAGDGAQRLDLPGAPIWRRAWFVWAIVLVVLVMAAIWTRRASLLRRP